MRRLRALERVPLDGYLPQMNRPGVLMNAVHGARRIWIVPLVMLALAAAPAAADARAAPPNVLVVMTDDQPYGSQSRMPFLTAHSGEFVDFRNAYTNVALCCPARATFLTGLYSHNTGIDQNRDAPNFDPTNTLATAFDDAGYKTGLFGKYLNGWPWGHGADFIPPGWDRWTAFNGAPKYYDYELSVNGRTELTGPSRRLLDGRCRRLASRFIEHAGAPFFAYYAPYGPHFPFTPAKRHTHAYDGASIPKPPNFNRRASDQHRFFDTLPRVDVGTTNKNTRGQYEALLSVDEALAGFYSKLQQQGELDNTILVFLTDNGYSVGSHRWRQKRCLYNECGHVPVMVRAPGYTGQTEQGLISNVDLAGTIAQLAGIPFGPTDGESLVPLMNDSASTLGRPVLLRSRIETEKDPPTGWGLRTDRFKYIRYNNGQVEMFDLESDPYELTDVSIDPAYADEQAMLDATLDAMKP